MWSRNVTFAAKYTNFSPEIYCNYLFILLSYALITAVAPIGSFPYYLNFIRGAIHSLLISFKK